MTTKTKRILGVVAAIVVVGSVVGFNVSRESRSKITVGLAEEVLRDYASPDDPVITPERIVQLTAEQFGITVEAIKGKRRTNTIALPRQVAMYLVRQKTSLSLSDIGAWFKRDHTTVLHACNKIEALRAKDPRLAGALREIMERLVPGN